MAPSLVAIVASVGVVVALAGRSGQPYCKAASPLVPSSVVARENASYPGARRLTFRIQLTGPASEADLCHIAEGIIQKERREQPLNAIEFFFYLPGTDPFGHYTAGKAVWAPDGERFLLLGKDVEFVDLEEIQVHGVNGG